MANKLNLNGPYREFHCPGCLEDHAVNGIWTWNGSVERPTFQPSVKYHSSARGICHFFVREGKIQFCTDCTAHKLSGQTLDLPDWETTKEEKPVMAETKEFKRGDQVTITAPNLSGVAAEILYDMIDGRFVCRISSSEHPSGHSQEGALVLFGQEQLEPLAKVKEIELGNR